MTPDRAHSATRREGNALPNPTGPSYVAPMRHQPLLAACGIGVHSGETQACEGLWSHGWRRDSDPTQGLDASWLPTGTCIG